MCCVCLDCDISQSSVSDCVWDITSKLTLDHNLKINRAQITCSLEDDGGQYNVGSSCIKVNPDKIEIIVHLT